MNFIEKFIERKIRRLSWKLTQMTTDNRIKYKNNMVESSDATYNDSNIKKNEINNKKIFLTMEEKKQMALRGEQPPVCIGDSNLDIGPVKYYPKTKALKRNIKL